MLVEEYFQVVSLSAARRGRQELLISNSIEVKLLVLNPVLTLRQYHNPLHLGKSYIPHCLDLDHWDCLKKSVADFTPSK